MMKEQEQLSQPDFERIEAYLLDRLSEEDRKLFEYELKSNDKLKNEVVTQRDLMLSVETGELKSRLDSIHNKVSKQRNVSRWIAVAASVAILVAVSIWMINKPDKADNLFAANLTLEPGLPVPMSATNNYEFHDAMVDYKSGKNELAISKWEKLLLVNPVNDTLNYFIGVAHFNDENYSEAIQYFEEVLSLKSSSFTGKGEWYLALSCLKTEDFERLNMLAKESQSDYAKRIHQLKQKLE